MSQVHSVTHVPVHSLPLARLDFLMRARQRTGIGREGVAGRNVPLEVEAEDV
jgi:hypothetical protein